MLLLTILYLIPILIFKGHPPSVYADLPERGIPRLQLQIWASKFGGPLFEFGQSVTKYNELLGRFQNSHESRVEPIKLEDLLVEITKGIADNLDGRVDAIQKLMNSAEARALEWATLSSEKRKQDLSVKYLNAKKLSKDDPSLVYEPQFGENVNPDMSSVHVPTSIYEKDEELLEALAWSAVMDETFRANRVGHPNLNWQYFGSSVGFMRQYPGGPWPNATNDVPDLYDCRFRPWYTGAANRPKNMIILLDVSGSMTGQRREIARHVVFTILDTLTENDFVAVFNFSNDIKAVLPCFNNSLVQANLEYVREIKEALDQEKTSGVANFPLALNYAFDVLQAGMRDNETAGCNNAIMLVTDGAPYNYEEIFAQRQSQLNPVRIFTYLTGKEVTDFREVRWMACTNQGYFVHISTLSEVQEQVLKYLPVMSRPLVMMGSREIHWTPIYADRVDVIESDWAWEVELANQQRKRSQRFRWLQQGHGQSQGRGEILEDNIVQQHRFMSRHPEESALQFLISASIPVFDKRNSTTSHSDRPTGNKSLSESSSSQEERIAKFLGVAGTDIPLKELKRLMKPFRLGVNGYAFVVNNNGHIVLHPDWRPLFGDILKPNYNAVDMAEVELMDSRHSGRNNDSQFLDMRAEIVHQDRNYRTFKVRIPQDNFKRVAIRTHRYEYGGIHLKDKDKKTPYSLVLVAPERMNRFHGEIEVFRLGRDHGIDVTTYFDHPNEQEPRKWTINPNWHYCEYLQTERHFESKEDLILHFLKEIQGGTNNRESHSWKWGNTGVGLKKQKREEYPREIYDCDKHLMQSLVFDANVTDVFTSSKLWKFNKNESQIIQIYGALMAFIATRSGLTRWIEFEKHNTKHRSTHPLMQFPGATDELWYQRAIDRYAEYPDSFVFSVPTQDASAGGAGENLKVTATRAVYVRKNGWEAPVAVVGIQFDHQKWAERFFEITGTCIDGREDCRKTCSSEEYDCFVLDDNGFILVTENSKDVGKFFGQVDGMVMEMLINSDVYKKVRVVDYQAVCLKPISRTSIANILRTPFVHIASLISWMLGQLSSFAWHLGIDSLVINPTLTWGQEEYGEEEDEVIRLQSTDQAINKTKLRPCDMEYDLYTYGPSYNTKNFSYHGLLTKCGHNCDGYFNVHYIPNTNLILVVTDGRCRCGHNNTSLEGKEVEYPSSQGGAEEGGGGGSGEQRTLTCTRPKLQLTRKRPSTCVPINPEEKVIRDDYCGDGMMLKGGLLLSFGLPIMMMLLMRCWIVG